MAVPAPGRCLPAAPLRNVRAPASRHRGSRASERSPRSNIGLEDRRAPRIPCGEDLRGTRPFQGWLLFAVQPWQRRYWPVSSPGALGSRYTMDRRRLSRAINGDRRSRGTVRCPSTSDHPRRSTETRLDQKLCSEPGQLEFRLRRTLSLAFRRLKPIRLKQQCGRVNGWARTVVRDDILHPTVLTAARLATRLVPAAAEHGQRRVFRVPQIHAAAGAAVEQRALCRRCRPHVRAGGAEPKALVSTPGRRHRASQEEAIALSHPAALRGPRRTRQPPAASRRACRG